MIKLIRTFWKSPQNSWLICFSGALAFLYAYMQLNLFNSISNQLIHSFNLSSYEFSKLSSYYLYAVALFFYPSGLLLDRFSLKKLMLTGTIIAITSAIIFGISTSVNTVIASRLAAGAVHSLAFLGAYRLITIWLKKHLALAMGLATSVALIGGIIAQSPFTYISDTFGWRYTLLTDVSLGLILIIIMWGFIPKNNEEKLLNNGNKKIPFLTNVQSTIMNRQNWYCALYTTFMNTPLTILGALWGNIYLSKEGHISTLQASTIITMLFVGTIIGSPIVGWVSDKLGARKPLMVIGSLLSFILVLIVWLFPGIPPYKLMIIFTALGITTSPQTLSYPIIAENSAKHIRSTALGFACLIIMGGAGLFQIAYGKLLDLQLHYKIFNIYFDTYKSALIIIPFVILISLIFCIAIKEKNKFLST